METPEEVIEVLGAVSQACRVALLKYEKETAKLTSEVEALTKSLAAASSDKRATEESTQKLTVEMAATKQVNERQMESIRTSLMKAELDKAVSYELIQEMREALDSHLPGRDATSPVRSAQRLPRRFEVPMEFPPPAF